MRDLLPILPITDARTANMFLLGLIFNQNQKSDRAFSIPQELEKRLGSIEPEVIIEIELGVLAEILAKKPAIHPFAKTMSKNLIYSCQKLISEYNSDARNIWEGRNQKEIIIKLVDFQGIGEKKAMVAVFLLSNHFNILEEDKELNMTLASDCPGIYNRYLSF